MDAYIIKLLHGFLVEETETQCSLIPSPSLDLPAFNVAFACNIKSWEIERGPGDEARLGAF